MRSPRVAPESRAGVIADVERLRDLAAWEQADRDAVSVTDHKLGCRCTRCCLIREESVHAHARKP